MVQLSGIAVILFIAFGSLLFVLMFLFAKRQIMRFALKFRIGPHMPIGTGAPQDMCNEIERKLDATRHIKYEPWLLDEKTKSKFYDEDLVQKISPQHLYRMKVVDDVKELCIFIKSESIARSRHKMENVIQYFTRLHKHNLFRNLEVLVLQEFLELYEHARCQDKKFTFSHYKRFSYLFQKIKDDLTQSPKKISKRESVENNLTSDLKTKITIESKSNLSIDKYSCDTQL